MKTIKKGELENNITKYVVSKSETQKIIYLLNNGYYIQDIKNNLLIFYPEKIIVNGNLGYFKYVQDVENIEKFKTLFDNDFEFKID